MSYFMSYFGLFCRWKSLKTSILLGFFEMERVKGIEPSFQAWEARVLPLNHTRLGAPVIRLTGATFCV
jgi:hypothetical protein